MNDSNLSFEIFKVLGLKLCLSQQDNNGDDANEDMDIEHAVNTKTNDKVTE